MLQGLAKLLDDFMPLFVAKSRYKVYFLNYPMNSAWFGVELTPD
jgi:hypothetical protein